MNNKFKAIIFILLNCAAFTFSMTLNKFINPSVPVSLKVLIRSSFGVLFFSPLLVKNGLIILISKRSNLQLLRVLLISMAMGATYFTYTTLPFTIAISIGFTGPIFTAVLAYLILKDRLRIGQWIAILIGYLGVVLMVNPQGKMNAAIYIAIVGNIATGLSLICTKKLTRVDSNSTIVILGNIGLVVVSFLWTSLYGLASIFENDWLSINWVWLTWKDFKLLIAMGLLGTISQLCNVKALKYASLSFLTLFEYSRLILAVPIGIFLGEALPGCEQIIGILLIIAATIYNSWQGNVEVNHEK